MSQARLAQIGLGGYGASIRQGLRAAGNACLVAVCDLDAELAARVAAETGAEARDADAILADESIAGVVLVLPNHLHRSYCEQAASAGKHVFVEKPIANRCVDATAMIHACRAAGVVLMVGHNYRRTGALRQVARWAADGAIGPLLDVQAEATHPGGLHQNPDTWRFDPALCPALPLIQLGVHLIDLANLLLGEPVEVTSLQRRRLIPGDNVDLTQSLCAYAEGALLSLVSHYCAPPRYACWVTGRDGRIEASTGSAVLRRQGGEEVWSGEPVDTQAEELREFAAAVQGQGTVETTGEGARRALAVCEAATRSAAERRTVALSELPGWEVEP